MKLKLDENLGERGRQRLESAGHEVCTVRMQALQSATDHDLLARCVAEVRALVTLDLDFCQPTGLSSNRSSGSRCAASAAESHGG